MSTYHSNSHSPFGVYLSESPASWFYFSLVFVSLLGAAAVIGGLYMVLWGKAKELNGSKHEQEESFAGTSTRDDVPVGISDLHHHEVIADESKNKMKMAPSLNLQEHLLPHKTSDLGEP